MTDDKKQSITYFTVHEVSVSLGIQQSFIDSVIEEGIVEAQEYKLDEQSICQIKRVVRLHQDLGVNIQGAALILELLEERRQLQALLSSFDVS